MSQYVGNVHANKQLVVYLNIKCDPNVSSEFLATILKKKEKKCITDRCLD